MASLENFITDFSKHYQLEEPVADDGVYLLIFDGDIEVRCFEKFNLVHLVSVLDVLPEKETLAWLKHLLNYALMRMKHGSVAATLDENDRVLLHTRFELKGLKVHEFEERLERYVNALEEHRHFLFKPPQSSLSASQMIFKP